MADVASTLIELESITNALSGFVTIKRAGEVKKVSGLLVESDGPNCSVGDIVWIVPRQGERKMAEVVGLLHGNLLLIPFENTYGISIGCKVELAHSPLYIGAGEELLGRIIDGFGRPIDGKGPFVRREKLNLNAIPPQPLKRPRIAKAFQTGIKAIDGLVTCGEGQRMGIFAGSGVGKSVLLGMIAKQSAADVNVIALIGERGREVREFVERNLGPQGLARSVVVVVTSEQAPVLRIRGANLATRIAEYYRDQGSRVLLMMDSLTRVAMAQREVGLAVGEPPTTKGYTPSVYALLPKLLERAGTSDQGSITGFYTVLVEGDDMDEPVSDIVRSILDGHLVLSRRLAAKSHYPAIDVLNSVSRLMEDVADENHKKIASRIRSILADYEEAEDLINIGAYARGNNPRIDEAIVKIESIRSFLKQGINESSTMVETLVAMAAIFSNEVAATTHLN